MGHPECHNYFRALRSLQFLLIFLTNLCCFDKFCCSIGQHLCSCKKTLLGIWIILCFCFCFYSCYQWRWCLVFIEKNTHYKQLRNTNRVHKKMRKISLHILDSEDCITVAIRQCFSRLVWCIFCRCLRTQTGFIIMKQNPLKCDVFWWWTHAISKEQQQSI